MVDTDELTDRQLLGLHCLAMEALRQRGVVRSSNNPVADHTETLVARTKCKIGGRLPGRF